MLNNTSVELLKLLLSVKTTIGPHKVATGIVKKSVTGSIKLTDMGLDGDFQVDRRFHGGFEKAICHYPYENYQILKKVFTHLQDKEDILVGENFSTIGLTEKDVHIGDTFKIGTTLIQVSQPRIPCWKLNHRLRNAHISKFIISQGISGWYYRVLEEGILKVGDKLTLVDRLKDSVSIEDVWKYYINKDLQKSMPTVPSLSKEWKFNNS